MIVQQLSLLLNVPNLKEPEVNLPENVDKYLLMFSGGKDSLACLIWLLENVDHSKIENWHHLVDGENHFFDWEITKGYVEAVAKAFNIPIYFSWLGGGFYAELMRDNVPHRETYFETPDGLKRSGGNGKPNTRKRFPAKVANLMTRWCSSALKIDVSRAAIANQERFNHKNIVVITGERREESANRAKYKQTQYYMQPTRKRTVYQHRPVLDWSIAQVWQKIEQYKIAVHPAYHSGYGRLSCKTCIFSSCNQWATVQRDFPDTFDRIASLERKLNHTIDSKFSITELAAKGKAYHKNPEALAIARQTEWTTPIFLNEWILPSGAYGEQTGSM
jgi:3'-phosphoadenosine 5'-phosphosulfate sulfotransferase (PAPS reductase)/FAD synthetase